MITLFVSATILNLLCLAAAAGLGYAGRSSAVVSQWHQFAGVMAAMVCCGVHCIVMTYFMATGKWVLHAVTVKRLDTALAAAPRPFKAQAYPAALAAMTMVFVAAAAGVITVSYQVRPLFHHLLALTMLVVNALAAVLEYRAIRGNARLIDVILAILNA